MVPRAEGWRNATVLAGAITAGTQVVLLREVLSAFLGNELIIGILFFDWLLLTGVGAVLAHRWVPRLPSSAMLPVALGSLLILPPLTFAGFRMIPLLVSPPGSMLDIWMILVGAGLALGPVCLVSGGVFSLLVRAAASCGTPGPVGKVYAWEAVGSLIGGVLFSVLLFDVIASHDVLVALCAAGGIVGAVHAYRSGSRRSVAVLALCVLLLIVARHAMDADAWTHARRYPGQDVLSHQETPFGVLTATRSGGQTSVYTNNVPLYVSGDIAKAEQIVHVAVIQRPHAPRVLVAGGNPAELVPEVLKYAGSTLICIEENPWLRRLEQKYLPVPQDSRVSFITGDLRRFLVASAGAFDVIIVAAPEPSTLQSNRLFTREALQLMRRSLTPSGVLCLSLPSSAEYVGDDARKVRAILKNTLAESFAHTLILPVGDDVFLASDSTLRPDVGAGIAEEGLHTAYVNAHYLQDDLISSRAQALSASLDSGAGVNTDARPILMLAQIGHWLRLFSVDMWIPALVGLAAVVLLFIHSDRMSLGVAAAGCGGIVLELMILMIVQVGFGNVYQMSGGLIGLYMAGMGGGAILAGRITHASRWYAGMQSGLALALLLAAALSAGVFAGASGAVAGLVICLIAGSFSAGAVFSLTSRIRSENPVATGSRLYGVDLMGSALGALLVGPVLLPLWGVYVVASSTAAVVAAGAIVSLSSPLWRTYEQT